MYDGKKFSSVDDHLDFIVIVVIYTVIVIVMVIVPGGNGPQ